MEEEKAITGRPTKFREEYSERAYELCLLGYTDKDLAKYFEVHESTIHQWKLDYPIFSESLNRGKDIADVKVVKSLYRKAMGFTETEERIFFNPQGEITKGNVEKYYPPDSTAMIFWLKNRQSRKWRDKHEQDINHNGNVIINLDKDDSKL